MALRDQTEVAWGFDSMPGGWQDRMVNADASGGDFGDVDPSCSWTYDGKLVLGVKKNPDKFGHYLVGQVQTVETYSPFGFWEARIEFPEEPGLLWGWWLQCEPPYATKSHVEVDISENYGNPNIYHTLWAKENGALLPKVQRTTDLGSGEAQSGAHNYGCKVTPEGYEFLIDNVVKWRTFELPINAPVHMCFSAKVQKYTVDDLDPSNLSRLRMKVDWVKKYRP